MACVLCIRTVSQDVVEAVNLLAQGKRNYMCGEVGHAVNQLQEACRLLYESFFLFSTAYLLAVKLTRNNNKIAKCRPHSCMLFLLVSS